MARFTNYATLSFNGGSTDSNTVVGELVETLTVTKTAVNDRYTQDGTVTFVISLVNSGTTALTGLSIRDDLGGYAFGAATVYPLSYRAGTVRLFTNGAVSAAPTVTAGPPLTISGITVPAGGSVIVAYEAAVTAFAPLGLEAEVTNTVTVTGGGLAAPITAQATIGNQTQVALRITKSLSPTVVQENGQVTYTFTIENDGAVAAAASDQLVLTDTFDPQLRNISVTLDSAAWAAGTHYTYNETTGVFATVAGAITVPAASFTQNTDGTYTIVSGSATLTVTGTV